jgi:hypothetical protein
MMHQHENHVSQNQKARVANPLVLTLRPSVLKSHVPQWTVPVMTVP